MKHEEIKGKRIILREQREEDAPFFAYWFNQPQVMFQCGFEDTLRVEILKKSYFQNLIKFLFVTTPHNNRFLNDFHFIFGRFLCVANPITHP